MSKQPTDSRCDDSNPPTCAVCGKDLFIDPESPEQGSCCNKFCPEGGTWGDLWPKNPHPEFIREMEGQAR